MPLPPGLAGYVLAQQQGQQRQAQQLSMLGQLAQLQGMQEDRALKRELMPLQIQQQQAQLAKLAADAQQQQQKAQFFSPANTQQYVEGGRPEVSLPADVQGPVSPAVPGQMNMDRLVRDAAARNFIPPEAYLTHRAAEEQRRATLQATSQARADALEAKLLEIRTRSEDKQLDRQGREALAREAIQARRDLAALTASLRQPPAPEALEAVVGPDGKPVLMPRSRAAGMTPAPRAGDKPLSATAQKELFEADDNVQGAAAAVDLLKKAKGLNDQAMGFMGAGLVSSAGTLLPESVRPKMIDATQQLDNLVTNSAVPQLKSIFGSNPTEGERRILLEIAGSSSKNPSVRKDIYDRAIQAAETRLKFNAQKAQQLREGSFFSSGGGATPTPQRRATDTDDPLGIRR